MSPFDKEDIDEEAVIDEISKKNELLNVVLFVEGSKNSYLAPADAQRASDEMIDEWGEAFDNEIDPQVLKQALRNYDADVIEGIIESADSVPESGKTAWLNDRLAQLNKTADIPGMEDVAEHLQEHFGAGTQQGAEFEIDWIAGHKNEIESVELHTIEGVDENGVAVGLKQGVDVLMKDGTYIELKSYDFSKTSYRAGNNTENPLKQIERDITRQSARDIVVVFDAKYGEMPESYRRRFETGIAKLQDRYPGVGIRYEMWKR